MSFRPIVLFAEEKPQKFHIFQSWKALQANISQNIFCPVSDRSYSFQTFVSDLAKLDFLTKGVDGASPPDHQSQGKFTFWNIEEKSTIFAENWNLGSFPFYEISFVSSHAIEVDLKAFFGPWRWSFCSKVGRLHFYTDEWIFMRAE